MLLLFFDPKITYIDDFVDYKLAKTTTDSHYMYVVTISWYLQSYRELYLADLVRRTVVMTSYKQYYGIYKV